MDHLFSTSQGRSDCTKVNKLTASLCPLFALYAFEYKEGGMKKYLVIGLFAVLALLFAIPLSAAEKVKIKLPDGIYLYDAIVSKAEGTAHIGFQKYFVVKDNVIYSQRKAVNKFGFKKLNEMFVKNKRHKILLAGTKVGEIYISSIDSEGDCEDGCVSYRDELLTQNIKENLMYRMPNIESAVNYMAVPEEYKALPGKLHTTIQKEEVDKITKLAKDRLFDLVKNREEVNKYKVKHAAVFREYLQLLEKVSNRRGDMYIGIYHHVYATVENTDRFDLKMLFIVEKGEVHFITSQYDDVTLYDGDLRIYGTVDVDGCGEEELLIEKLYPSEDGPTIYLAIYKRQPDNEWKMIRKILTTRWVD